MQWATPMLHLYNTHPRLERNQLSVTALVDWTTPQSNTMYPSIGFRKSNPQQNRQLEILFGNSKR